MQSVSSRIWTRVAMSIAVDDTTGISYDNTTGTSYDDTTGTQSGDTTRGQSGPRSDANEGVLRIPQRPSITGTAPSE